MAGGAMKFIPSLNTFVQVAVSVAVISLAKKQFPQIRSYLD